MLNDRLSLTIKRDFEVKEKQMIRSALVLFAFSFVLSACRNKQPNDHVNVAVSLKHEPITGSIFIDSKGHEYDFRILKVHLTNDTIIPLVLEIYFPKTCFYFYPFLNSPFKVFLLPDSLKGQMQYEFITGLDSCPTILTPSPLQNIILPKQHFTINVGTLSEKSFVSATYSLQPIGKSLQDLILQINGTSVLVGRVKYAGHDP